MLKDKVIIYDDSCPMCKLYTYWFVAWGFLSAENRIGFATAPAEITSHIDLVRGRHEIPLFDRSTNETIYGLEALTHILGSRWTWLNPFFKSRLFYWMFHPVYEIITYNRRVIAGCKACCGFDCAPDLNKFYRSVYLAMASCVIGIIMTMLMLAGSQFGTAAGAMIGAFLMVGVVAGSVTRAANGSLAAWNYFGNYITTTLIVAGTLIPVLLFRDLPSGPGWIIIGAATLLGLAELRRREL